MYLNGIVCLFETFHSHELGKTPVRVKTYIRDAKFGAVWHNLLPAIEVLSLRGGLHGLQL